MANRKSYTGFPTSHQPRFYAASNLFKMGIKYLNLSSFIQVSTIKDEKSAAKFHYMKTVSGKVVAQSIAFRVVSIYWQGVAPFPWYLNTKGRPSLEAPALHTLHLIARQPSRHCVTSLHSAHWLASSLKLAARCPVSGCWSSCLFLVSSLLFFCFIPCGRLCWLLVSFWAHVNIVHCIVSYHKYVIG